MSYIRGLIKGQEVVIKNGDKFLNVEFEGCTIDDVTNAPFDDKIFYACYFENTKFKSEESSGTLTVAHVDSYLAK